jgi:hypothetical protein
MTWRARCRRLTTLAKKSQLMAALLFLLVLAVQRDFLRLQIGDHTFDPVNRELVIDRG